MRNFSKYILGMRTRLILTQILIIVVLMISCKWNTDKCSEGDGKSKVHKGKVEETINTSNYTYLRVDEGCCENWIAVPKQDVEVGKTYYFEEGMEMVNFKSKELDTTFKKIYFVQEISDKPIKKEAHVSSHHAKPQSAEKKEISVKPVDGGITIAELYSKRDSYSAKSVVISGEVVKVNYGIMGKNWVHIQDGTKDTDNYDLTITTNDEVKVGDIAAFEGIITLKKDFGSGYFYEVIMEEAILRSE